MALEVRGPGARELDAYEQVMAEHGALLRALAPKPPNASLRRWPCLRAHGAAGLELRAGTNLAVRRTWPNS